MKSHHQIRSGKMMAGLVLLTILFMVSAIPSVANSEDRLIVKDDSSNTTFRVEDSGLVETANRYRAQSAAPGFWLDETDTDKKGAFFVLDSDWMQVQRRAQGFGAFEGSVLFINVKAPNAAFYLNQNGYLGLGKSPSYPLHLLNGAYCSAGGMWFDASSREYKQDIKDLTVEEALKAFEDLKPVKFKYKTDPQEDQLGFIAEDVPELVATKDRKGMSPMDVVAVLTKVVQEQQKTIERLSTRIENMEAHSR